MNTHNIVSLIGWGFLIASWIWPSSKWGGRVIKIALAAFASGVFLVNVIYALVK